MLKVRESDMALLKEVVEPARSKYQQARRRGVGVHDGPGKGCSLMLPKPNPSLIVKRQCEALPGNGTTLARRLMNLTSDQQIFRPPVCACCSETCMCRGFASSCPCLPAECVERLARRCLAKRRPA